MTSSTPRRRMRLGELLVAAGVLDETHLNAALAEQRRWGGKLGRVLVDMGFLSEDLMAKALSKQLGLPRVDLERQPPPEAVTGLLGVNLCEQYGVFPLEKDTDRHVLRVAAGDPTNYDALDEIAFRSGMKVEPVIASPSSIERAIRRYYYGETAPPSTTLEPSTYGLGRSEQTLDPEPAAAPPASPPAGATDLAATVDRLEKTVAAEVRAIRGLVELLVETGVIKREDYLAKVRGK